jgi:hypothetical protein
MDFFGFWFFASVVLVCHTVMVVKFLSGAKADSDIKEREVGE